MRENIVEIQEEVSIPQDGKKIILEKGDKIQILKEFYINKNNIESDFLELLNANIPGYGESGPMDGKQYLATFNYLLGIISNDLKDAIKNEFSYFTDETVYQARKMLTSSLQSFLKNY